jgi:hypothetical protein
MDCVKSVYANGYYNRIVGTFCGQTNFKLGFASWGLVAGRNQRAIKPKKILKPI